MHIAITMLALGLGACSGSQSGWVTILCAGESLRTAVGLSSPGLPAEQASALAKKLLQAEKDVSPDRLPRMAAFKGIVRMGPDTDKHGDHSSSTIQHAKNKL